MREEERRLLSKASFSSRQHAHFDESEYRDGPYMRWFAMAVLSVDIRRQMEARLNAVT